LLERIGISLPETGLEVAGRCYWLWSADLKGRFVVLVFIRLGQLA